MSEPQEVPRNELPPRPRQRFRGNSLLPQAHPTFIRQGRRYVLSGWHRYENSLLATVGLLEFFNALDFPANVWNEYPVPTYATVLMALGGATAIIGSAFAAWDMERCWKNIAFLRKERRYLQGWHDRGDKSMEKDAGSLLEACMDVNYRELGWEIADRFLMDALMGVGLIIVGAGTILAIFGIDARLFHISNLLSGYVGNSFGAVYAVINVCWSTYMWRRAREHHRAISAVQHDIPPLVRRRVQTHSRRHQIYALVNGASVFVASIGGLISATMWQGYVVLIPCVLASLFVNFFWRHKLGYSRDSIETWIDIHSFDVLDRLSAVISMHNSMKSRSEKVLTPGWTSNVEIVHFLKENGLYGDFCGRLLKNPSDTLQVLGQLGDSLVVDSQRILAADHKVVGRVAQECINKTGQTRLRNQERYLLELLGCFLCRREMIKSSAEGAQRSEESTGMRDDVETPSSEEKEGALPDSQEPGSNSVVSEKEEINISPKQMEDTR